MTGRIPAALCWAGLLGLLGPGPARAADHTNLDENLPVTVEDAYVTPGLSRSWGIETGTV